MRNNETGQKFNLISKTLNYEGRFRKQIQAVYINLNRTAVSGKKISRHKNKNNFTGITGDFSL